MRHLICRAILSGVALWAGGCAAVGPASISNGRSVYNEVINATEDQQLLNLIVRERYGRTFGMLTVASVTANVSFRANASAEARAWGGAGETAGNIVPLSAGVAYEENPTISYVPMQGEEFLRRVLTPLTVEEVILMRHAADRGTSIGRELFRSINGIQNPVGHLPSVDFQRLDALVSRLDEARVVEFGRASGAREVTSEYYLRLHDYDEHVEDVRAVLDMLGIEGRSVDGRDIYLPVRSLSGRSTDAVNIETRTALDWIRHAAGMIDVPAEHLEAGIVEPSAWADPTQDPFMTIRTSKRRPENAIVAVEFRGWWYFVDAGDMESKRSFKLMKLLIGLRLGKSGSEQQIPVLTIPAG